MPDYNFIMDSRLRPDQLKVVNQLGRLAASQGLNVYLAGGAVRDLILGLAGARHLTFVVEGNIQRILRPLTARPSHRPEPAKLPGSNEVNLHVTTVTPNSKRTEAHVVFEGGVDADVAMSRNEVYHVSGRPPEVSSGTIFDDLRRRDFSIDAMAISLHPNSRGLLLDPTNGAADIERKEIRALHSRSFFDEPARIYRLLRLGLRFDFKPDEKTDRWLGLALEERVWEHLSEEQQGRELRAILGEEQCGKLLKLLHDRDLLAGLDRKVASSRIEFDKFERIRSAIRTAGGTDDDAVPLNFLALVAKLPGAEPNRLAKKILKDPKTIKTALGLHHEANRLAKALGSPKVAKASQIYTLLASSPPDQVIYLLVHDTRATIQNRVKAYFTKYPAVRATVPRAELESLGMAPGPAFEKVMDRIFLDELDGKIKSPEQRTKLLMDYGGIKPPPAPSVQAAKTAAKGGGPKAGGPKGGTGKPSAAALTPAPPAGPSPPAALVSSPPDAAKSQARAAGEQPSAKAEKAAKTKPSRKPPTASKSGARRAAEKSGSSKAAKATKESTQKSHPAKALSKHKPAAKKPPSSAAAKRK